MGLGLLRFIGDTLRIKSLDQIGFVSGFSPLPLVFSDRGGVEDFAHHMLLSYVTLSGLKKEILFDQKLYSKIEGPLYLVGTYSVAIAYSPRFPKDFWEPVLQYGLCKDGSLKSAIGEKEKILSIEIDIQHFENKTKHWREKIVCPS